MRSIVSKNLLRARCVSSKAKSSIHSMSSYHPNEQLFSFTRGRWLWNEKEQLDARYRRFNIPNLKKLTSELVGSTGCLSLEKIGEGSYNKAFRLIMQNNKKVIVKIPNPNAGPAMYTTASEVATMDFGRTVLNLPIPKVLAWSATNQNPVESEYIIMEEANGHQLHGVWSHMELETKRDVIAQIVDLETKMLSVSFDRIGSLYFKTDKIPNCEPFTATAASKELAQLIESHFSIGPIVRQEFWEGERMNMHCHHGPWKSARQYLESIAKREIEWIKEHGVANKKTCSKWQFRSDKQNCPEAHVALLHKFISAIPSILPKDPEITVPSFWHPDFHSGNIYVDDNGKISSIIDWQGTWTAPLFIGANPPQLLDYSTEMMMKGPENFDQLDQTTKDKILDQVTQSILIHSYERKTARQNPLMHQMMRHVHGKTLKKLEAFANASWDNCLLSFRESLIQVHKHWDRFGVEETCPYSFSEQEIEEHYVEAIVFNENRDFWDSVRDLVNDEGYTKAENYDKATELLQSLQGESLPVSEDEEQEVFEEHPSQLVAMSA